MKIQTYVNVVTTVGTALVLEQALAGATADALGMLMTTAIVIVLPLVAQQSNRATKAAGAAQHGE